jgi:hypothetical protein
LSWLGLSCFGAPGRPPLGALGRRPPTVPPAIAWSRLCRSFFLRLLDQGPQRLLFFGFVVVLVKAGFGRRHRQRVGRTAGRGPVAIEIVIALEALQLLDRHVELVGDPGVRAPLANPQPDLVQL